MNAEYFVIIIVAMVIFAGCATCGEQFCYTDNGLVCENDHIVSSITCRPSDERIEIHKITRIDNTPRWIGCAGTVHISESSSDLGMGMSNGFMTLEDGQGGTIGVSYPATVIKSSSNSGNLTELTIRPYAPCQVVGARDTMVRAP